MLRTREIANETSIARPGKWDGILRRKHIGADDEQWYSRVFGDDEGREFVLDAPSMDIAEVMPNVIQANCPDS